MEFTFNNDTIFFNIISKDFAGDENDKKVLKLINKDVINFQVKEEMSKPTTGSLTVLDKGNIYSNIFQHGMEFEISWGYKNWNRNLADLSNFNKLQQSSYREGLKGIVLNFNGSGNETGEETLRINFFATELLSQKRVKTFTDVSKYDVIDDLFNNLGILEKNRIIKLNEKILTEKLDTKNSIYQIESSYSLLKKLADEWHCILMINNNNKGEKIGSFIDVNQLNSTETNEHLKSIGAKEYIKLLYYNAGSFSNVRNYTWSLNIGDSGQGVFIRLNEVNGEMIFTRYIARTQQIIDYRLNEARLENYLQKTGSLEKKDEIIKQIYNSKNFQSKIDDRTAFWFFDKIIERTAPDGMGYTVNCSMLGDPFITPGLQIEFMENFTNKLRIIKKKAPISFVVYNCTHTITKANYITDLEVVDSYVLNNGFLEDTKQVAIVQ